VAKKKTRKWNVPVDPELDDQVQKYVDEKGVSLAAFIRRLARLFTNPEDPRELPPGMEEEKKRGPRRRR
jgi:hypothetical protein